MTSWKEEIATTLKREAAKLPPNSRFYPIRKMMTRFNTSQRTIEQVMEKLVTENVMIRRPGDGYFTRDQSPGRLLHYRLLYPKWPSEMFKSFETIWADYSVKTGDFRFSSRMLDYTEEFYEAFPADDCDALLITPPAEPVSRRGLRYLCSLPFPVVFFDTELAGIGISSISEDSAEGGAIAAAHLINHGHRRLAILVTEPHVDNINLRCQGFVAYARLNGVPVEILDTHTESWHNLPNSSYNCLEEHLKKNGLNFSGLFLTSAERALEVYKVFKDYRVAIPDDVSIVTHDELAANQLLIPPLDSVMPDYEKIIAKAHSELRKVLRGEQSFFRIRLTPRLTERGSVRTIASPSV